MPQILVIDDESNFHEIVAIQLQKIGCDVLHAFNGQEGEQLALQHNPDLILLDIMMPIQGGYETCQHLRAKGYRGAITMISALQEATGSKMAKERGANGYLIKPLDLSLVEIHLEYAHDGMKFPTVSQWLEHSGA